MDVHPTLTDDFVRLDEQETALLGVLSSNEQNEWPSDAKLFTEALRISVGTVFDAIADNIHRAVHLFALKVISLVLSMDDQAVCAGVQVKVKRGISVMVRMARGLNDKWNIQTTGRICGGKTNQWRRFAHVMDDIRTSKRLTGRFPGHNPIKPGSPGSKSITDGKFANEPKQRRPIAGELKRFNLRPFDGQA